MCYMRLRGPMRDWTLIGAVICLLIVLAIVVLLVVSTAPTLEGG